MDREQVARELAERPKFEYILNAMENAAAQDRPADHDFFGKRQAVLKYVADLELECRKLREALAKAEEALSSISKMTVMNSRDAGYVVGSGAQEEAEAYFAERAALKAGG